jgi:hypothetical protein
MERLALDACRRMSADVGAPAQPEPSTLQQMCAPVLHAIDQLTSTGVELKVAIAQPTCGDDAVRQQQCGSFCGVEGVECRALCRAQAAIYAQCSLPSVAVAVSKDLQQAAALATTLERNLPTLLYAELALGRRLLDHAEVIVRISAKLPKDVQSADARGIACVTLAAATAGKSAAHLNALLSTSSALTSRWETAAATTKEAFQ